MPLQGVTSARWGAARHANPLANACWGLTRLIQGGTETHGNIQAPLEPWLTLNVPIIRSEAGVTGMSSSLVYSLASLAHDNSFLDRLLKSIGVLLIFK